MHTNKWQRAERQPKLREHEGRLCVVACAAYFAEACITAGALMQPKLGEASNESRSYASCVRCCYCQAMHEAQPRAVACAAYFAAEEARGEQREPNASRGYTSCMAGNERRRPLLSVQSAPESRVINMAVSRSLSP